MGCLHTSACPLFPHLNESLAGWRSYYCDNEENWRGCARYQMSLTGERVPITLLPNGRHARHLAPMPARSSQNTPPGLSAQPDRRQPAEGNGWLARVAKWMKGSA